MNTNSEQVSFIDKFTVLKGSLRELWLLYGTKILAIVAYSLVNSTLVLWLSSDLGYSDVHAGMIVAVWSSLLTLATVMVGSLVDAIGIRKSFLLGFGFCILARFAMAFFAVRWIALPFGLLPLVLGEALQVPVMVAAVKRFATPKQRSIAFSLYYAMMNVGFAIAGWSFDKVRSGLGEYGHFSLPLFGTQLSSYQTIIFIGLLFTIPNLLLVYFGFRSGIEATEEGPKFADETSKYPGLPFIESVFLSCRDAFREWLRIFTGLWAQPSFYRFLSFCALVVFVKMVLYHMYYTFPKYGIRELGQGAPVGRVFGFLNAVIVVVLAPVIGALTQKVSVYKSVVFGAAISAVSVFFMAMPPVWFSGLAAGPMGNFIGHTWLGIPGPVNPLYISIVLSVIVYSIGEAFYSPRLYEYPAMIAPKGQEGSYMALSMLPYFFAKFFAVSLSGFLLEKYCPAAGPRNSQIIWLIVGLMALASPVGLMLAKDYIHPKTS